MAPVPSKLGKYDVLERLAKGGMAEVYRGRAVGIAGFERIIAVKRILPKYAREPRFIRSFIDEARVAASLNHKNIVQVLDFGKAEGELFLTMELIDGVSLRSAMRKARDAERQLPTALACYIASEVAAGLDYAHRKVSTDGQPLSIVHCDVSPHNVMLSYDGFVKLVDFGVARATFTSRIQGKRLRGKPRYMAPEQTLGDTPTAATDAFALAIVAWEMLTGLQLFDGSDVKEVLASVRRAEVPEVDKLNPDVPPEVSHAISRTLSVNPSERHTVGDLAPVFAKAARDLVVESGARGLAAWLAHLFTRPTVDDEVTTTTQINFADLSQLEELTGETMVGSVDDELSGDITTPPSALVERRRAVATVVLIDGPAEPLRNELSRNLATLAMKRNAVVPRATSHEVVAVFGLEIAGEDDVASAMQFALDGSELTQEAASGSGAVEIRMATWVGVPAVRRLGAYDLEQLGIEEARRLASEAEPGRALLAGPAGRLAAANFAFRERPSRHTNAGKSRVLELVGATDFDQRARALSARKGRFFGRSKELDQLVAAFEDAQSQRQRRTVTIIGESGVGKSRLIAEFAAQLAAHPQHPLRVAVSAAPDAGDAPFSLFGDVVAAALNLPPERGRAARNQLAQRLRQVLDHLEISSADRDDFVAGVEQALEIRDGARVSDVEPSARLRERVSAVARRMRQALPQDGRPRVLIVEDVHNADLASLFVLSSILDAPAAGIGELAIMTSRQSSASLPGPVDLEIILEELIAVRELLIQDRLGDVDAEVAQSIAELAGGNPLFIEELAQAARSGTASTLPASLSELVLAAVDRLPAAAKAALQHAAVMGPVVKARMLEELVDSDLSDAMTLLIDDGLLLPAGGSQAFDGEGEFRFRHGLIREAVYESLADEARRDAHRRVGTLLALRHRSGRDEPPSQIARHLEKGGDNRGAARFWRLAGEQALAAFDADVARDCFTRALAEPAAAGTAEVWSATLGRARAAIRLGRHTELDDDLKQLRKLASGDGMRELEHSMLAAERHVRVGDSDSALREAADAERLSRSLGDELARGHALRLRGEAYEQAGDYRQAAEAAESALFLFRDTQSTWEELHAQLGLGRVHLRSGAYRKAESSFLPILEKLETWGDPWLERLSRTYLASVQRCMGQFEQAMASAETALEICRRHGDVARTGDLEGVCGQILAEVGMTAEADVRYRQALDIHGDTGSGWGLAECEIAAGSNASKLGQHERGVLLVANGLERARSIGARSLEIAALLAQADVHLAGDSMVDLGRAFDNAVTALELSRASYLRGAEVSSLMRLGRASEQTGDIEQASRHVADAIRLLGHVEFIDGAEEDIHLAAARVAHGAGDISLASLHRQAALTTVTRKLDAMQRPAWLAAYRNRPAAQTILGH